MPTYGIVVEGNYDAAALPEIIKKCLQDDLEIISRVCGDKNKLMNKFPSYLEPFRYEKGGSPIDKALVICDADNKNPDELLEKMKSKIAGRDFPFELKFIIIVQELETWLLADEAAISKVTQRTVSRVNEDLESINHPKEKLFDILSEAGATYTSEVAKKIAIGSDIFKIEYRCPKFKEFKQAVIDC